MVDHAIQVESIDHFEDGAILIKHAVHRVADADENALGKALQRACEVVLETEICATGGKPQIGGMDKGAAPFRKQLVEPPEDGIAGDANEGQPVLLFGESADAAGRLVSHLLDKICKVTAAFGSAAKAVGHAQVDGPVGEGVEE